MNNNKIIQSLFAEHIQISKNTLAKCENDLAKVAKICIKALKQGNKILLFGNGGSASDAQHISAELTGKFSKERDGLCAFSLSTDTSAITSIGNDYGYEHIFSRQINGVAKKNDVLIGISTSGTSANVVCGLEEGLKMGCINIGFSGKSGGYLNKLCDVNLVVPSDNTARIQEMHIIFGHSICQLIDNEF
jgi:D-sedoheptulose 7-phosphate isomerase